MCIQHILSNVVLLQGKIRDLEMHSDRLHATVKKMGRELQELTEHGESHQVV
jgi:hypothetical protein